MATETAITFDTLVQICPELIVIQDEAHRTMDCKDVSLYWEIYESIKSRIKECVGLYAKPGLPDFVYTAMAYDCVHKSVFGDEQ